MRLLLLFIFLTSSSAYSQRKLSPEAFRINVRPVLQGILGDFYQMVTLFPDFPKEIVGLMEAMDDLAPIKETLRSSCPGHLEKKCLETIENLRGRLAKIEERTMKLYQKSHPYSSLHLSAIGGTRVVGDFHAGVIEVKGQLDNAAFLIHAKISPKISTYPVLKQLDELSTELSLTLVEFVPYAYREDFRHFYFNFVRPIQMHISNNRNYEFLNRNVNALNFSLNLLNMNLTKRNKKTPDGMAPYLATIHNRWNSLLRYYF